MELQIEIRDEMIIGNEKWEKIRIGNENVHYYKITKNV